MTRLKDLRDQKGLSQIAIQVETGIDQSDYSKIERGLKLPTLVQAIDLATLYDTSVDYIVGLTDERKPYPRSK